MSDQVKPLFENHGDEAGMCEWLHDLSISNKPSLAAQGRLMKELFPVIFNWYYDEVKRGDIEVRGLPKVAHDAALSALLSLGATMADSDAPEIVKDYSLYMKKLAQRRWQGVIDREEAKINEKS